MIVVNFKTYTEAAGNGAVDLALILKKVADETKLRIVAVPQIADLQLVVETGVETWAQHVDDVGRGKFTGWVNAEDVVEREATGTLLNHSEHKIQIANYKFQVLEDFLSFQTCVCADRPEEIKEVLTRFTPSFFAYEPAEYIGSTDKSVASERPEIISEVVKVAGDIPVLIGAGVHSANDVKVGLKLGAKGILLATNVVLSKDPEKSLRELVEAFKM